MERPVTRPCPACGGTLWKCHGVISEPVFNLLRHGGPTYATRPVTFWGCDACEHCEEHDSRTTKGTV